MRTSLSFLRSAFFISLSASWVALSGCGSPASPKPGEEPGGPRLLDLPPGIFDQFEEPGLVSEEGVRQAAKAVVRLERPTGTLGTAFYLGEESLLVTNAHVLGPEECLLSGCTLRLHEYEHRLEVFQGRSTWKTLVPYAYSESLDLAVYTVFKDSAAKVRYKHPDRIAWNPRLVPSPEGAVDQKASLLGHPLGYLLKRMTGPVVSLNGPFLTTELMSLPGTSGGPLLTDKGELLGIHHRGTQDLKYVRNSGYFGASLATTSRELAKLLAQPAREKSLAPFRETSERLSAPSAGTVAWEAIAYASPASGQENPGGPQALADWLWGLCTRPSGDFAAACDLALLRLSCPDAARPVTESGAPEAACPEGESKTRWLSRFQSRAQEVSDSSKNFLWSVVAPARLTGELSYTSRSERWASDKLERSAQGSLDLDDVVLGLDATRSRAFEDEQIRRWFAEPQSIKKYNYLYSPLLRGAYVLARDGVLDAETGRQLLAQVKNDPLATLVDLLLSDALLWRLEAPAGRRPPLAFGHF